LKPVLNTVEAAEYLGFEPTSIRKMAREGRIPCQKVGRDWRFLSTVLEGWLAGDIVLKDKKEDIWDSTNKKDLTSGILESVTTETKYEKLLEQ